MRLVQDRAPLPERRALGRMTEKARLALAVGLAALVLTQAYGADRLAPVGLGQVEVGGEIGRRIDMTIHRNLLVLEVDNDFLLPFKERNREGGYIGLGKLMDSLVHFAAYTNEEQVLALKKHVVTETIGTQDQDGYIGMFVPERRIKTYWDLHEMVYIIHGLVNDYRYFKEQGSLDAARRLGDYIMQRRPGTAPPRGVGKLNTERAFLALAEATGQKKYLDYCVDGMNLRNWAAPVQGHAYTFMNVCISQLDLYRTELDQKLLAQSRRVIDFLTASDGLVISGTCSMREGFHSNQEGRGDLGESCATAYLIRLLDNILQIEGNALYGDMMERSIYNALFAAQSPDGRRLRYFTPFDGQRTYYHRDTYCCPNNFRRIIAELPGMIYYRWGEGLAINLYAQSRSTVSLKNGLSVKVRQETDYPNSGEVAILIGPSRPVDFPLRLRIPRWCDKAKISLNGQEIEEAVDGGSFFTVNRQWKPGDRVELDMPMRWRVVGGRKMQEGRVAIMRGPLLFCLNPSRQEEKYPMFGGQRGQRSVELGELQERVRSLNAAIAGMEGTPVNLADIVGGGAGFGSGKRGHGIDPRNGKNTTTAAGYLQGKVNSFTPVGSRFVDGVLIPDAGKGGKTPVKITSTGITITGLPDTCGQTWDFFRHGPGNSQKFFKVADVDYGDESHSMLAIHANKVITFDVEAIRKATGYRALRFRAVVGYGGAAEPTVDFSVYLDGKPAVSCTTVTRAGAFLDLPLGPEKRFLTFAVTDANQEISHDQIFFGDPLLVPERPIIAKKDTNTLKEHHRLTDEREKLKRKIATYPTVDAVLKGIRLDMMSLGVPVKDTTVRPDGLACHVRAWSPGCNPNLPPDLNLVLTEFADPGGEAIYFNVSDPDSDWFVDDELSCSPTMIPY